MSIDDDETDEEFFEDDEESDGASATGKLASRTRAQTLASLTRLAKKTFATRPETNSLLLCVAQYWADEADDAVHAHVVASSRPTPLWPHACDADDTGEDRIAGESCDYCGDVGYLPFDDNGVAIAAFQAYCHEHGSQEEPTSANYTPYAIARRAGGEIEIEVAGVLHRPYEEMLDEDERAEAKTAAKPFDARAKALFLEACAQPRDDGPRRVLADYLLERDDPRGEYISLALAGELDDEGRARRDALLAEHRWSWIHPLGAAIPRDHAVFERGLLAAAEVYVTAEEVATYENALAWASVERLHFLPGSSDFVSAVMMSALRDVGPLAANGLAKLAKGTWAIERLHVSLATSLEVELLAASRLPALRHLVIEPATGRDAALPLDHLTTAAWWRQLERVTWLGGLTEADDWLARLAALEPVPQLAIGTAGEDGRPAGWDVAISRTGLEVSHVGWDSHATRTQLRDTLARLPELPVELVPSRWWTPTTDDVTALATPGRSVSIR